MTDSADNNLIEIWKQVVGFEGLYEVSNRGRIRSLDRLVRLHPDQPAKPLKGQLIQPFKVNGRNKVDIKHEGLGGPKFVARVVCEAFHGAPFKSAQAAHRNGIKTDDRAENLRWLTPKQNQSERIDHGTDIKGSEHPRAKLNSVDVLRIRQYFDDGQSDAAIAVIYGVSRAAIYSIRKGETWGHV